MSTALRIVHGNFGRMALLEMDASLVRHAHPHCHVLLKVDGADTQFLVGNTAVPLTDSSAVMVDGWQPHAYVHDPSRPCTLILALYVEPQWLKEFRPAWAASGSPGFFARPCGEISPRIRQLTRDLAADMMARPECRDAHEVLLSDLMIAVIERFTPWRSFSSSVRAMDALPRPDWRIRRVAETIRTDVSRNFDVDVLAKQAGLSRAHFFRLFESSIGVPPRVYLNVMRLERAVDAVVNQNGNIGEIGKGLGFDVPAHFTRFFSGHTGVNPRQFRAVSRLAS